MNENDIEAVASALISRMAGFNRAPVRSRLGIGSGVARPAALDSPDLAVRRDARASYVAAMTDRCPVEELSVDERREVFEACQDRLRQDGYHL